MEEARHRLAARTVQPYNQNAILFGFWDDGRLVKEELALVEAERAAAAE
jgi:hypothetical protein